MDLAALAGWAGLGYLCGSIPFGLLLTRLAGLGDVRAIGSGNIGATNVLRTGNKALAAATLLCDALKGTVPVAAAGLWAGPPAAVAAGVAAFLGHILPVWLGFKGGKGVATYLGVLAGLWWPLAAAFVAVWLAVAVVLKRSSLAALIASAAVPAVALWQGRSLLATASAAMAAVIVLTHRANIGRLLRGEEPPISLGGKLR